MVGGGLTAVALVTMYSRATCGLCDEAREVVLDVRAEVPFHYDEILIDGDPELEGAYGARVPVVAVDGREEFELTVDRETFRAAVAGRLRD